MLNEELKNENDRQYKKLLRFLIFLIFLFGFVLFSIFKNTISIQFPFSKKENIAAIRIQLNGSNLTYVSSSSLRTTTILSDIKIVDETKKDLNSISIETEISIDYVSEKKDKKISKFRCSGSENDITTWPDRVCVFSNLCYNTLTNQFNYFRLLNRSLKPLFYDASKGMLFQFSQNVKELKFVSLTPDGGFEWAPIIADEEYPTTNFVQLNNLHSLTKSRFADSNIAHGLWEDLGSVSYSMDRMNVHDKSLTIMHFGSIPKSKLYQSYLKYVIPALTSKPMVVFENYVKSFNKKFVCFDKLVIGGQLSVFPQRLIRENHGREQLFYNWRSKIIQFNGFDPNYVPNKHLIVLTNKSHSIWTHPSSNMHRAIVNLEEVYEFIKKTYPTITVQVIEWHKIEFNKQIEILINTTILITPCGGVSLIIPFLPHGAHAIVMDYYVSSNAHGFQTGQSASMEGAFLNHVAHVKKEYYQIYGPQDYRFDYPGATDAREAASIVIDTKRLQLLIDKSLEEMNS